MEASELKEILDQHKLWIETNGVQGQRANLRGANLTRANLYCANLRGANLEHANLYCANLQGADLQGADLTGTILEKNKAEKQPEVSSVKSETSTRQAFEKLAKEHGFKIVSLGLELL